MADKLVQDVPGYSVLERMLDAGDGTFQRVVSIGNTSANPIATSSQPSPLPAGTNRSGSITTGGTAQSLAPANSSRQSLTGQNISAGDLWINEIGSAAAPDTAGSYKVASGDQFSVSTNRAISIYGATTGQKFTATET